MANLGKKNSIYYIHFRFQGKEYKKSLKTNDAGNAVAAKNTVELTIYRPITGLIVMSLLGIDPGDVILTGAPARSTPPASAVYRAVWFGKDDAC